jgi:hypothetical protein
MLVATLKDTCDRTMMRLGLAWQRMANTTSSIAPHDTQFCWAHGTLQTHGERLFLLSSTSDVFSARAARRLRARIKSASCPILSICGQALMQAHYLLLSSRRPACVTRALNSPL